MKRRGWRIGSVLLAGVALVPLLACTQAPHVDASGGSRTVDTLPRCGVGSVACGPLGDGCCAAGSICTADQRCAPDMGCTMNQDCSSDSACAAGRCRPWSDFPAEANFDPDCTDGVDRVGVTLVLPDLTVSADPALKCLINQARARVSLRLCNRGLSGLSGGEAGVALVDAAQPALHLCELANANELRAGACETLSCDVDAPPFNAGFDIAILADPSDEVSECTEGKNNTALISSVFCEPPLE